MQASVIERPAPTVATGGFPRHDVAIIRDLGRQVVALAQSDRYEARRERWRDVNARRRPDRAPVWCWGRPEGFWKEVMPESALGSTDPFCRNVEATLRRHLFKDTIGDDHVFEPWWAVSAVFDHDTPYVWGDLPSRILIGHTDLGGFRYDPPIKTEADYERIGVPHFRLNPAKTDAAVERMEALLGDAMAVRLVYAPPLAPVLGTYLEHLRGMAPLMQDLAFCPELVHRAMAKFAEGVFQAQRAAEATGRLTPNNSCAVNQVHPYFYSDPVNPDAGSGQDGHVGLHGLWTMANSQEFDQVSPAMQDEFLLNYQIPLFQQYGAVQYGCCENLTRKIAGVLRIPNLRTFVCSAWTDLDQVAEACGTRHVIQWRQSAAAVVLTQDLGPLREHLEGGMRRLRGHFYQVALRELETLHGRLDRLHEWTRLAIDAAERYA